MPIESRIVSTATRTDFDFYGEIEDHKFYKPLIDELNIAGESDYIVLHINSPGGRVEVGQMIVRAIQRTKAKVIANIVYPSASMASVIACACHGLSMEPNTYLMFHTYSGGAYGKGEDLLQQVVIDHQMLQAMDEIVVRPFLTKAEYTKLCQGKNIYINASDDNIKTRIARHFKLEVSF